MLALCPDGFLEGLSATDQKEHGALFDEVMTGFRIAYGGARGSLASPLT